MAKGYGSRGMGGMGGMGGGMNMNMIKQAQKMQQDMLKMQQEPIAILGAVGAHFRRISTARTIMDSGKGPDVLMRLCSLGDYPARKTMAAAKNFSSRFCARAAALILETDRQLKTSYDDPQRLMELLLLQLSQEALHG